MEQPRQISTEEMIRAYYPELLLSDSLGFHLSLALESIGSSLIADPNGALKGDRRRSSGLSVALLERRFLASLSLGGIYMGAFGSSDLVEIARVLDAWCRGGPTGLDVPHFAELFPSVRLEPETYYFDAGPAVYTARAWANLLSRLKVEVPLLYPAAALAFEQPQLVQMFPFTSHWRLRFSTATNPAAMPRCMPIIVTMGPDSFIVQDALFHGKTLGKGTARDAVEIVLANLPAGCGPAQHMD